MFCDIKIKYYEIHVNIIYIGRDGAKGEIGGRCQGCRPGDKGSKGEPGLPGREGLQVILHKIILLNFYFITSIYTTCIF